MATARKPAHGVSRRLAHMIELRGRKVLVTGGTGFIGSALVRASSPAARRSAVSTTTLAEPMRRLGDVLAQVELVVGDVRDPAAVASGDPRHGLGVPPRLHQRHRVLLRQPELVLEVAVKGMMNVLDACLAEGVRDLIVASSSEVYQNAGDRPDAGGRAPRRSRRHQSPLLVRRRKDRQRASGVQLRPQALRPRRSSSGRTTCTARTWARSTSFRSSPMRMQRAFAGTTGTVRFPIQGTGRETRAFIYIDDFTEGAGARHRAGRASERLQHRHARKK